MLATFLEHDNPPHGRTTAICRRESVLSLFDPARLADRRTGRDQLATKPLNPIQLHDDEQSVPLSLTLLSVAIGARHAVNLIPVIEKDDIQDGGVAFLQVTVRMLGRCRRRCEKDPEEQDGEEMAAHLNAPGSIDAAGFTLKPLFEVFIAAVMVPSVSSEACHCTRTPLQRCLATSAQPRHPPPPARQKSRCNRPTNPAG